MRRSDGTHISLSGNDFNAVGLDYTPNHQEAAPGKKDVQTKFTGVVSPMNDLVFQQNS